MEYQSCQRNELYRWDRQLLLTQIYRWLPNISQVSTFENHLKLEIYGFSTNVKICQAVGNAASLTDSPCAGYKLGTLCMQLKCISRKHASADTHSGCCCWTASSSLRRLQHIAHTPHTAVLGYIPLIFLPLCLVNLQEFALSIVMFSLSG